MKHWVKVLLFCAACVIFIGADRITKQLAREHLMYTEPRSYFHDTFRFEYVENTGAALSLGDELPPNVSFWLLGMLPLVFLLALFVYVVRHLENFTFLKLLSFAMIVAGGLGNIIDRIIYDRHVTDFMNMGIGSVRTGIFNVADVFVTSGVIGLLITYNTHKQKSMIGPEQE